MKKDELLSILEQRKSESKRILKKEMKLLDEIRKEKELSFDRELLGGIQHPIGYMNGMICEIENLIRLLNMTFMEYEQEKKIIKSNEKKQRAYLRKILFENREILTKSTKGTKTD